MMFRNHPILLLLGVLFTACNGSKNPAGGQSPTGSTTPVAASTLCSSICARVERCPGQTGWASPEACTSGCGTQATVLRSDVAEAFNGCIQALDCQSQTLSCLTDALVKAYGGEAVVEQDPIYKGCAAKDSECKGKSEPFNAADCAWGLALVEAGQNSWTTCLAKPCSEVEECFKTVLGMTSQ